MNSRGVSLVRIDVLVLKSLGISVVCSRYVYFTVHYHIFFEWLQYDTTATGRGESR